MLSLCSLSFFFIYVQSSPSLLRDVQALEVVSGFPVGWGWVFGFFFGDAEILVKETIYFLWDKKIKSWDPKIIGFGWIWDESRKQ